jgi:hypothetical protein
LPAFICFEIKWGIFEIPEFWIISNCGFNLLFSGYLSFKDSESMSKFIYVVSVSSEYIIGLFLFIHLIQAIAILIKNIKAVTHALLVISLLRYHMEELLSFQVFRVALLK